MTTQYQQAIKLIHSGDTTALADLLKQTPELITERDDSGATLLTQLIDWPGHRPNAADTARVLLAAGAEVDARREGENGTPLAGVLCTEELDVIEVLVEAGADLDAPLNWRDGTVFDLADELCQNNERSENDFVVGIRKLFTEKSGKTLPTRPAIGKCTPVFFVEDVDGAIDLYGKIGFRMEWSFDDCEKYLCMSRGGLEFHMSTCQCEDKRHNGNLNIRIPCSDADAVFQECIAAGFKERYDPRDEPWGFRECEVIDPWGNWLNFFGPANGDENE